MALEGRYFVLCPRSVVRVRRHILEERMPEAQPRIAEYIQEYAHIEADNTFLTNKRGNYCPYYGKYTIRVNSDLRCYACSFSAVDTDRSCLTITDDTMSVDCPYQYCTIMRQEYVDPVGEIASFIRGCEEIPDFLNHDITDTTFRTYYRACTNDLCNIGDGIQSVVGGSLSPTPEYLGSNLLVPGSGATTTQISLLMVFIVTLMNYIS